jgi:hypothetical protein
MNKSDLIDAISTKEIVSSPFFMPPGALSV